MPEINVADVKQKTQRAASDGYFRALVDGKLPRERLPDDELLEGIVSNPLLKDIYHELLDTEIGLKIVLRNIEEKLPGLAGVVPSDFACQVIWTLAAADPRFDLIVKQALDDLRSTPRAVRSSSLGTIAKVLEKIRQTLASASAGHSNATLLASILAALLAGGAAHRLVPALSGGSSSTASSGENMDSVVVALSNIGHEIHADKLNCNVCKSEPPVDYQTQIEDLKLRIEVLSNQEKPSSNQAISLAQSMQQEINNLDTRFNLFTKQIADDGGALRGIETSLQNIEHGIVSSSDKAHPLPSLQESANGMVQSIGTISTTKPTVIPLTVAVADARASVARSYQTYLDSQPPPLKLEATIVRDERRQLTIIKNGAACLLPFKVTSITKTRAVIVAEANTCAVPPGKVLIDGQRHPLQGGNDIEIRFEAPDKWRIWPLKAHGAILAVYSKTPVTEGPVTTIPTP